MNDCTTHQDNIYWYDFPAVSAPLANHTDALLSYQDTYIDGEVDGLLSRLPKVPANYCDPLRRLTNDLSAGPLALLVRRDISSVDYGAGIAFPRWTTPACPGAA